MNALPNPLDQLASRLDALEERVQALEGSQGHESRAVPVSAPVNVVPAAAWPEQLPQFTGVVPQLGSALLGIAGAYALRAVSGANLLPRNLVALIAAIYAGAWLFSAAKAGRKKVAGVLYAAVSILILGPMLWEMTVRFGAMSGVVAALVLASYTAAAGAIGLWRHNAAVFSIAFAGSAITAVALSVATHRMLGFTLLLLTMLVVCEAAERKLEMRGIRALVALAADVGVWTLLLIYRLAPADRTDYSKVSTAVVLACALFLFGVEIAAVARQMLVRRASVTVLVAMQAMVAFGLAAAALQWLAPGLAVPGLGSMCVALAAGCYTAAYGPVRRMGQRRNFGVLNVWAACLLLGGVFTLASAPASSVVLGIAAVAAIALGDRMQSTMLEVQGLVFLAVAAVGSGLLFWAATALAGPAPAAPAGAGLAAAVCAILSYAIADERAGEEWRKQALHLVPALLAAIATAAVLVLALLYLTRLAITPDVFHVALIRTLSLCALALGLAYAGSCLGRPAMVRTSYVMIAFVMAKLLFEDLRHGHMEFIAGSIFAVALTLIAVPRLAVTSRRRRLFQ